MSTNHNRIKVADLETNQPNKILTTNLAGQLEFRDINTIKVDSYNALDYTSEGKALDARQGKVLKDLADSKVDKVNGKSLLSDAEITRLGTLANYTHPTNHAPSIIAQDPSNRFVSDAEKAIWNAKQSPLTFVPENATNKNIAGGYAGLGADGKLISSQLPAITINDTFVIASQAAMLALTVQTGDLAIRTDLNKSFILKGTNPAVLADWQELLTPTSAVTTVFGRNGAIISQSGDYTADQISETTTRKFQSANQQAFNDATSSIQTQLNAKPSNTGSGASGTWGININGHVGGAARFVDLLTNRVDNEAYSILWGAKQGINTVTGNPTTYAFSCDAVKIQSSTGTVIANNFSGSGAGLTGTASSLNIGGNANTSTTTRRLSFIDGPRNLSDRLPNTFARTVNFDFVNAATVGGSGNYGGVMTFAPWDGLSSSTGDSSYQLAFRNESGINGSGLPGLRLRKGIDTTWGGWYDMLHSGNYGAYSAFSGAITGASLTVTGDVTAFSDARVKENIRPIANVIERIQASRGILYDRIDTKQKDNIGFIAQELEKTFPELVITQENGTKAVKYQNAVAILFEAIKEQQAQIDFLLKK